MAKAGFARLRPLTPDYETNLKKVVMAGAARRTFFNQRPIPFHAASTSVGVRGLRSGGLARASGQCAADFLQRLRLGLCEAVAERDHLPLARQSAPGLHLYLENE